MSIFLPVQRATLLIPSGEGNHLFILVTNPKQPDGYLVEHSLIVGIGSVYQGRPHDSTCYLYPGDHPFIQHQSYVNYKFARIQETEKLLNGCKQGIFHQRDILDSEIFARVCYGLTQSIHTAPKVLTFYHA